MQGILSITMLVDIFKATNICSCFSVLIDSDHNHKVRMIVSQHFVLRIDDDHDVDVKGDEMNKNLFTGALSPQVA